MVKAKKVKKNKIDSEKKEAKKNGLSLAVYNAQGKVADREALPKDIFQVKTPPFLLAQAARVYLLNKRRRTASTKTRAEVRGGGRKPWRQKGTGRARVGSIRVPHFRGGGVVFGPKPQNTSLNLPRKMRQRAFLGALTEKFLEKKIVLVSSLKTDGKTKNMLTFLKKLPIETFEKQSVLLVMTDADEKTIQSVSNLDNVTTLRVQSLNTYQVLASDFLVLEKGVIEKLKNIFLKKE